MTQDCKETAHRGSGFFARQPIFDAARKVWGFEILYRGSFEAATAQFSDSDSATLSVIAGLSQSVGDELPRGKKVLVNFSEKTILAEAPLAFPPRSLVIEFPETCSIDEPFLDALGKLRQAGYTLALDDYEADPAKAALREMADILIVDVLGRAPGELEALADKAVAEGLGRMLQAKKVEDEAVFAAAKNAGFTLFQGFFFQKPELVSGRRITSGEMSRLRLLRMLQSPEPDFAALASAIKSDPAISVKLLRFLNCPLFAFTSKVTTIERALTVLGWKQLKNWLRVIIFTDAAPTERELELAFSSVQRGKFFENAAEERNLSPVEAEQLFLLGLFSLLDAMFGVPMRHVLDHLGLDETLLGALTGERNELSPWLDAARAFESGDWAELDVILQRISVEPMAAAKWYAQSLEWANTVFKYGMEPEKA